jgi:hypothetical protein
MLKRLSNTSWGIILVLAAAWPLAWIAVAAGALLVELRRADASGSGGIAAFKLGVTPLGALFVIGPPVVLLILRALGPRIR